MKQNLNSEVHQHNLKVVQYLFHLDNLIEESQSKILELDSLLNKTLSNKKELKLTYLNNKIEKQVNPNLGELSTEIDSVLKNAEQQLENPEPKAVKHEIKNIYDDYIPPQKIVPTLEPYKAIKKPSAPKPNPKPPSITQQKQKVQINIPPPKRQPSMQRNPEKIGNQPIPKKSSSQARPSTSQNSTISSLQKTQVTTKSQTQQVQQQLLQKMNSPKMKVFDLPETQPQANEQKSNNNESKDNNNRHQQINEQKVTDSKKVNEQFNEEKVVESNDRLHDFSQDQNSIFECMNGQMIGTYRKRLKEVESSKTEYQRNINYFYEKETKARNKFLTKFYQHSQEKRKIYEQRFTEQQNDDDVQHEYFSIESKNVLQVTVPLYQDLVEIKREQILISQFQDLLISQIDQFVESFQDKYLNLLSSLNQNNITKLQQRDLVEIFKIWNLIQLIKTNISDEEKHLYQLDQKISIKTDSIMNFLSDLNLCSGQPQPQAVNNQTELFTLQKFSSKVNNTQINLFNEKFIRLQYCYFLNQIIDKCLDQINKGDQKQQKLNYQLLQAILSIAIFKGVIKPSFYHRDDIENMLH